MPDIQIGTIGAGYMGKAHSVAMKAVATVFDTTLRPQCEMIATRNESGAQEKARAYGYRRATGDWRKLVQDPTVEAVVIASPQNTHLEIVREIARERKPVFCEKPLGASLEESREMVCLVEEAGLINMVGFNYIRTPASQLARELILAGEIGRIVYVRAEHTEDFLADPKRAPNWRTEHRATGNMGDLAPHILNAVRRLAGPITELVADIQTIHQPRPTGKGARPVYNDDQAHLLCRFENGALGALTISRVAIGRKMGYAYEITGTKGAIRFDQEDQNALWFYERNAKTGREGFTKILTGPHHPDYLPFCQGAGHGTGYNDQMIIEARDFLEAIATNTPRWPTFREGMEVNRLIEAAFVSHETRTWVQIKDI